MKGASRGPKRRWGPHISSPWPQGGENEKDGVNVPTACGIETHPQDRYSYWIRFSRCNSAYCLRYWSDVAIRKWITRSMLQQCLPFAVCDEGGETVEKRSDDEVRTSLVPDYKEGKTKRMEWKYLLFTVLKRFQSILNEDFSYVATALTACGMRRTVWNSRGLKRRWGPHISSPWPKGGENEKDRVNVPTACGIETTLQSFLALKRRFVATVLTTCSMQRRVLAEERRWDLHISSPWPKGGENEIDRVNVFTDCGIKTRSNFTSTFFQNLSCNSTYHLRYVSIE